MATTPATQAEVLKRWCQAEEVDPNYALLVLIPTKEDIDRAELDKAIDCELKTLGRVKVKDTLFSQQHGILKVLCETKEPVDADKVPSELSPGQGLEPWTIVTWKETPAAAEDFNSKLSALLQAEGKTQEDLQALLTGQAAPQSPTEAILRAVGDLLDKTKSPSESGGYRRLRIFSD